MTPKFKFIARHLLMVSLPIMIGLLAIVLLDVLVFKETIRHALSSSFIIYPFFIPVMEITFLLRAQKRAKRLNISLWPRALNDKNISHTFVESQTSEQLIDKLSQGNWKYKIIDEKIVDGKTVLLLKHYQIPTESALFIELDEQVTNKTSVTFKAKSLKESWFTLVFSNWSIQLKQIEYFKNIIENQEELNAKLSLIE